VAATDSTSPPWKRYAFVRVSVASCLAPGVFALSGAHEDRVRWCTQEIEEMQRRLRQMEEIEQHEILPAAAAAASHGISIYSLTPSPFLCVLDLCFVLGSFCILSFFCSLC
jgi:hypothetical protein